jgi:hypothetical protein
VRRDLAAVGTPGRFTDRLTREGREIDHGMRLARLSVFYNPEQIRDSFDGINDLPDCPDLRGFNRNEDDVA